MVGVQNNIVQLYFGKCDVWELKDSIDDRGVTVQKRVLKYSDLPCRLVFGSRRNYSGLKGTDNAHKTNAIADLRVFLDPDVRVEAGSVITVRQGGRVYALRCTAQAAVYKYHQEIMALPDCSEV